METDMTAATLLARNPDLAADYARQLASLATAVPGRNGGKRVSTIFDPRYGANKWVAFWDDYKDGDVMARGATEDTAIMALVEASDAPLGEK